MGIYVKFVKKDEELISRIKSGDSESMEILVKEYFPITYKRVRRLVPVDDAEDVTQDIFMNLVGCIDNFEGRSGFATWFNSIVLNRVADYHRRMFRYKSIFIPEGETLEQKSSQETHTGDENNDMEMEDLLMKLPEPYREVLLLRLRYDLSFVEIASALGIDYEAVRSRYRRGIRYAAAKIQPHLSSNN